MSTQTTTQRAPSTTERAVKKCSECPCFARDHLGEWCGLKPFEPIEEERPPAWCPLRADAVTLRLA